MRIISALVAIALAPIAGVMLGLLFGLAIWYDLTNNALKRLLKRG